MWKKISTVVLGTTLLLGGLFSSNVDATAKSGEQPVQIYSKIYTSMNGDLKQLPWHHVQELLKNWGQWEDDSSSEKEPEKEAEKAPTKQETQLETENEQTPQEKQPEQEKTESQQPAEKPSEQESAQQEEQEQEEQQRDDQIEQLQAFEQEVVELTNVERENNGLAPLKASEELSHVAREKSNNMAEVGYFDHNSPTYGSPFDMMQSYGIDYRTAGENIAKGQQTPEEVVNAWMNSPGHRENIMNGNFTHIGVGYVEDGNHWTQMFTGN